jgi:hypothetical protein
MPAHPFENYRRERFHVSESLPPDKRKQGYRFEVIDAVHPSDGGPVAIGWYVSLPDALEACRDAKRRAGIAIGNDNG